MAPSMAEAVEVQCNEEFECKVVVKNTFITLVSAHGLTRQSSAPAQLLTCDPSNSNSDGRSRSTTVDSITSTNTTTVPTSTSTSAPSRHKSCPDVTRWAEGSRFVELDIDYQVDARDDGCMAHSENSETCEEQINDLVSEDEEAGDSNAAAPPPQEEEEAGDLTKRAEETEDADNSDRELEEARSPSKTARRNQRRKRSEHVAKEEEQRRKEIERMAKEEEDGNGSEKSPKSKKKKNKKAASLQTSTEIDDSQTSPTGGKMPPKSKSKKKKAVLLENSTEIDDSQTLPNGCAQVDSSSPAGGVQAANADPQGAAATISSSPQTVKKVKAKETSNGEAAERAALPDPKAKSAALSHPAKPTWQGVNPTVAERVELKREFMDICRKQFDHAEVLESNSHSVMTPEQLAKFNCNSKRPLVSIHGDIFDVSKNSDVYGPGGLLCFEAGFDITWAVVTNSRNKESCNIFCDIYKASDESQVTTWFLRLCNAILTFERDYGKPIARLSVFREERTLAPPPSSVLTDDIAECCVQ